MADRVGAVYVEVLTDTSNVKPQIERAYKDLGEKKGTKVAKDWWKGFRKETEAAQKQIRFDQLSRSINKSLDAVVKAQAARIKKVVREGGRVELKISKKAFADLEKLAKDFDEPLSEVLNQFVEKLPSAYKKAISDAERVLAKEEADREKAEKKRRAAEAAEVAAFQKLRAKAERDYELDQINRNKRVAAAARKQLDDLFALANDDKPLRARVEKIAKSFAKEMAVLERSGDKRGGDALTSATERRLEKLVDRYGIAREDLFDAFDKIAVREFDKIEEAYGRTIDRALADNAKFDKAQRRLREKAEREYEVDQINREKRRAKRLKKEIDDLELFAEGRDGPLKRQLERLGKEFVTGIRDVSNDPAARQLIVDAVSDDLRAIAKRYEVEYDRIRDAFDKITEREEFKQANRDIKKELDRGARDWELFKNWQAGRDYNGSLDKLAADIERATTTGTRKAFAKNKDVDFGPAIQARIDQVIKDSAERYGKSADQVIRALRTRVAVSVTRDIEQQSRAFDTIERKITGFRRRVLSGGGLLSRVFIGPFALAAGAAGGVLQAITAIGPAIAKVGSGIANFGVTVAKVFPKVGIALGRMGSGLAKIAKPIAALLLPVALIAAWGAFSTVLSSLVVVLNAVAVAATIVGTALVGAVSSVVLLGTNVIGLGAGLLALKIGTEDAFSAIGALNKAVGSGAAKDWEAYNEALGKLGENAQAAVKATRPLIEAFKGVKQELSEKIFLDVAPAIGNLETLAQKARDVASGFGEAGNVIVRDFLGRLGSAEFAGVFQGLGDSFRIVFQNLGLAVNDFFFGFSNAMLGISPVTERLSQSIGNIASRFLEWTQSAENMERLQYWFQKVYDVSSSLFGVIMSLIGLVASLFNQSAPGTVGALETIKAKLDEWKLWVDNNKGTINTWIERGKDVIRDFAKGAGDVLREFQKLNTDEARAGLKTIISLISGLLTTIARVASAWASFKESVSRGVGESNGRINSNARFGRSSGYGTAASNARINTDFNTGRAAGGFIRRPELSWIGEAGPEVVIPLARPIGMVDPEVRELTKMVRGAVGGGSTGYSQQKVWNVTQNITAPNGSPDLIAAQVLNRFVVAARG